MMTSKAKKASKAPVTMTIQSEYDRKRTHEVTIVPGESITIVTRGERQEPSGRRLAWQCFMPSQRDEVDSLLAWLEALSRDQRAELGGIMEEGRVDSLAWYVVGDWIAESGGKACFLRMLTTVPEMVDVPFVEERTFRVGDQAEHSSYNLSYFDPIKSITAKTVTIDDGNGKTKRLKIEDFVAKNWDFDLAEKRKHNSDWRD